MHPSRGQRAAEAQEEKEPTPPTTIIVIVGICILVAILIVFFPVMINVLTAIRAVDPDLINLPRAFNSSRSNGLVT